MWKHWNGEMPKETIGHIQSAGCLGQKEVVTAAHNACIWELLSMDDAFYLFLQKQKRTKSMCMGRRIDT